MDRRQQKTRAAIFNAFSRLLSKKSYSKITIQEIIDEANIGRSTFYAHFETKDSLLENMCTDLFNHIVEGIMNHDMPTDDHDPAGGPHPAFCHLLQHIKGNTLHSKDLLISESSDIFLRFFKHSLNRLIRAYLFQKRQGKVDVPEDFLLNHISGSFVEMVQWWVQGRMKESPEELGLYFQRVIDPIL
ncbi:MAG: TetR/AcrR family transcriptional regulator [Dialister sp.]|nr:TetR/AcrR family transcriptional regulator [Dialister sp.]